VALDSFSIFYYGHEVTAENNRISFDEGGGELIATLTLGFYSLTDYAIEVQAALNDAGALTYTCAASRTSRLITISADGNFDLLFDTGSTSTVSANEMLGFDADDFTGDDTYTGTLPSGSQYRPQFILQDYLSADDNNRLVDAVVNKAANGRVQVIRFGSERFIEMNIKFITDLDMDGKVILNNPDGVDAARDFMNYVIKKSPIEFMEDISTRSTFYKVLLESTPEEKNGTAYKLKEMVSKNLPGLFETGKIQFRVLE
jgi:hypothetical protein